MTTSHVFSQRWGTIKWKEKAFAGKEKLLIWLVCNGISNIFNSIQKYNFLLLPWFRLDIQSCCYVKSCVYFTCSKSGSINFMPLLFEKENYSAFKYETKISSYSHYGINWFLFCFYVAWLDASVTRNDNIKEKIWAKELNTSLNWFYLFYFILNFIFLSNWYE